MIISAQAQYRYAWRQSEPPITIRPSEADLLLTEGS